MSTPRAGSLVWRCSRACLQPSSHRTFTSTAPRPATVRIVEVGPRDGLQNEKNAIPVETKISLVDRLADTGITCIEAGSFVSPKWTPQMANSSRILEHVLRRPPRSATPITYQWLLPNVKGLENMLEIYEPFASEAGYPTPPGTPEHDNGPALNTSSQDPNAIKSAQSGPDAMTPPKTAPTEISLFTAATETFTKKNTNCTIAESLERFKPIMAKAKSLGIPVRAYISVALGCPYEGPDVNPGAVADLAISLLEMGAYEISVADTTGMGTAPSTDRLLKTLSSAGIENRDLALHFHDTYGQALVNSVVSLEHGIRTFDSAVAGLGGCPFSPGATGNVATEDLVHCFHSLGVDTGIDIQKLARVGEWISDEVGRPNESRAGKAVLAKLRKQA
ncbi:aldolase [Pseudovirgaria hyperparasitica]|uniref:hydroxymethylglutaryl-CoA lyase n=1 Tax=Pseudovirgaria hyperparasitica TaxID=470096 RepID=A0A6A6WH09_9PEZI|nr:aldolase [Pseudovirgaria hyperparasitica]KAF2762088.1 aldolase [Pseudovirgaria hyperparasitica]